MITIGAFLSLSDNIVAWSLYLLLNDKRVLVEDRCRSRFWNFGLLLQITLLNSIAIIYVFNRLYHSRLHPRALFPEPLIG